MSVPLGGTPPLPGFSDASEWVISQFAWRWSIEVLFRASKQTMEIEAPQHWFEASVEKVAPWVWSMQSVILVWYLTAGRELPQAVESRKRMGGVGQRVVLETHGSGTPQRNPRYRI